MPACCARRRAAGCLACTGICLHAESCWLAGWLAVTIGESVGFNTRCPATARRQLHDLYDQYLIALVAYFDTERCKVWRRRAGGDVFVRDAGRRPCKGQRVLFQPPFGGVCEEAGPREAGAMRADDARSRGAPRWGDAGVATQDVYVGPGQGASPRGAESPIDWPRSEGGAAPRARGLRPAETTVQESHSRPHPLRHRASSYQHRVVPSRDSRLWRACGSFMTARNAPSRRT